MNWFARGRVPRWCAELSEKDWDDGARAVQRVLHEYGELDTHWRRTGRFPLAGNARTQVDLHLGPLLRDSLAGYPRPAVQIHSVRREFEFQVDRALLLVRARSEEARLSQLLMPLMVPGEVAEGIPDAMARRWSDGVVALLCVRAPQGTRPFTAREGRAIGVDPDALWTAAMKNQRKDPLRVETTVAAGLEMTLAVLGDRFGLGHLLRLDEVLPGPAPHGVLVGTIGAPGLFACHRLVRRLWAEAATDIFRKMSPDPGFDRSFTGITGVHWWREGSDDAVRVGTSREVSPRMREMLDALPE